MEQRNYIQQFLTVAGGSGFAQTDSLYKEELQLALRNKGMPLEGLRYPKSETLLSARAACYIAHEEQSQARMPSLPSCVLRPAATDDALPFLF
jgi:hypothetical protein